MQEINVQINIIEKEIEDIGEQLALIRRIIIDFSDASEWDTASQQNKSNEIDEVWEKRKPYLNFLIPAASRGKMSSPEQR